MHQNVRDFKEKRICVDEVIDYTPGTFVTKTKKATET